MITRGIKLIFSELRNLPATLLSNFKAYLEEFNNKLSNIENRLRVIEKELGELKSDISKHKKRGSIQTEKHVIRDLHGNIVPPKSIMAVKSNGDSTRNVRRCKAWGCMDRPIKDGYCQKHHVKFEKSGSKY